MAYIPGPSDKNTNKRESRELKKTDKPVSKENSTENQSTPFRRKKKETEIPKPKKEKVIREKPEKAPYKGISNPVLMTLVILSVFLTLFSFYKMFEISESTSKRLDAMSDKYNRNYTEIKKMAEENKKLLEPDGIIDKFITAANLIEDYSVGIDQIIDIAQSSSFKNVGFMRVFVSGSEPVWVSITGSNGRKYFAENLNPGISEQSFYYYKKPSIEIKDIDYPITSNFEITSGNYDRTYLLFFNFGSTKIVKMEKQTMSNPLKTFDIWLPK